MRHVKFSLAVVLILMAAGCGNTAPGTPANNKPLIVAAITTAAEIGTNQGLKALAKSNPTAAAEAATALKRSIDTDLLPYLKGGSIGSAAVVRELLNSSLFKNVAPAVRDAIAAAGAVLDAYLPAPNADTFLTPDQVEYVVAFLTGISKGCTDFGAKTARVGRVHWIEMSAE